MKNVFFYILTTLLSFQFVSAQVAQKIFVEHFTNTNCGICANLNPGFYSNYNMQSEVLHLAIHPSAPYASCLLSQQNVVDADARTHYYNIYGSTPRLVINGNIIASGTNYSASGLFTPFTGLVTPVSMHLIQTKYNNDSVVVSVTIKNEMAHNLGALQLFVALAEDTVFYTGTNGEAFHYDVFRKSLTNSTGNAITLPSNMGDSVVYTYVSNYNNLWDFNRIYTIGVLQNSTSKWVVQAAKSNTNNISIPTAINNNTSDSHFHVSPNPIKKNNMHIEYELPDNQGGLFQIFDVNGKVVYTQTLPTFSNKLDINIPKLAAGIYNATISTKHKRMCKLISIVND